MERTIVFTNQSDSYKKFNFLRDTELPFLEQSRAWKEGMKYQYSPESYIVSENQYKSLKTYGVLVGDNFDQIYGKRKVLEFRIDYMVDQQDRLWATEFQTDDRGLPAMALARNSKGVEQGDLLPGTCESIAKTFKDVSKKDSPTVLLIFPETEYFYYAGTYDMAYIFQSLGVELIPVSSGEIQKVDYSNYLFNPKNTNLVAELKPDFVWNYIQYDDSPVSINPIINKQILLNVWGRNFPTGLRNFIPETRLADSTDSELIQNRSEWMLKPISGRWSQGVIFGPNCSQDEWVKIISRKKGLLAQKFIEPKQERIFTQDKGKNTYSLENYVTRLEGYYVYDVEKGWMLADILATCTKELPVHGKRDCIMIPGFIGETIDEN